MCFCCFHPHHTLFFFFFFTGRIIIDGANLTISNVTSEDQGIYSCLAQTALDSVTDVTQVTVLGKCANEKSLFISFPLWIKFHCSWTIKSTII